MAEKKENINTRLGSQLKGMVERLKDKKGFQTDSEVVRAGIRKLHDDSFDN